MSFEDTSPDAGESGGYDGPEDGDTGSEAPEQYDDEAPEPERQYLDIEDADNRYVRVKVDGEDQEVPLSEALRGYSREADYTRKAQAVAEARREAEFGISLQRALEADPNTTMSILAQRYGINFGAPPQAPPEPDEDEYVDPLERTIVEERNARLALEERLAMRDADEQLRGVLGGLQDQYGLSNDDLQEVVQTAYQQGLGIHQLPMVWKTMAFDRIDARVRAARERQREDEADNARRTAAKSAASQTITARGGGANGLTSRQPSTGNMSLRDAIEAAFDEHEGRRR